MVGGSPREEPLCYFLCGTESSAHNKVSFIQNCIYPDSAKLNKVKNMPCFLAEQEIYRFLCGTESSAHNKVSLIKNCIYHDSAK